MSNGAADLHALYVALDTERMARGLTWAALTREVNRFRTGGHPIATSTIRSLRDKPIAEGDGVLQMLVWLERTPESFVPGMRVDAEATRLPRLADPTLHVRWDTRALYTALDAQRQQRGLHWADVAREAGSPGSSATPLRNLANGGRTSFPAVMRIVRWLQRPAVTFTRITDW